MLFIDPGFEKNLNTAQWFSVNYKFLNLRFKFYISSFSLRLVELRQFPNTEYSPSSLCLITFVQNKEDSVLNVWEWDTLQNHLRQWWILSRKISVDIKT